MTFFYIYKQPSLKQFSP